MDRLRNSTLRFFALSVFAFWAATTQGFAAPHPINGCQTINASGSYVLTGNVTANGDCLLIAADSVTIDLDGHTITGPGNGSSGVTTSDTTIRYDITIRNGMIKGFGAALHFALGKSARRVTVERMTITGNTANGIILGAWSIVKDCIVNGNGGYGIYVGEGSLVVGNITNHNGSEGIHSLGKSLISDNVANNNGDKGIYVFNSSNVLNNTASGNGQIGIYAYCPSMLNGNAAANNDRSARRRPPVWHVAQ